MSLCVIASCNHPRKLPSSKRSFVQAFDARSLGGRFCSLCPNGALKRCRCRVICPKTAGTYRRFPDVVSLCPSVRFEFVEVELFFQRAQPKVSLCETGVWVSGLHSMPLKLPLCEAGEAKLWRLWRGRFPLESQGVRGPDVAHLYRKRAESALPRKGKIFVQAPMFFPGFGRHR